ncbi:MAG TPA: FAD-dependent oxidoreductase [Cytophagaceae bacterium]|jgi:hypothetical protein|nr:FAD-dependent oxidoreductase [Cytophagaceae bacterium]
MVPEIIHCEVLVAGGGSAGIAAAVAAARKGANVVLLEKNSFLGGKATAANVGTVCGSYLRSHNPVSTYIDNNFVIEFVEKLKSKTSTAPIFNKHGLHFLPYHPFDFKLLCDGYAQSENIKVFFQSSVSQVEREGSKIVSVYAVAYDRLIKIQPLSVIDCTGEALLSLMADALVIESDEYQTPAQVFSMEGVEATSEANLGLILLKEIQNAIFEGTLMDTYSNVSVVPGSLFQDHVTLKIGIPEKIKNDVNKITEIEFIARKMIQTITEFLTTKVLIFKNARLSEVAPEAGIRTGRRHKGNYILTKEEVLQCHKSNHSAGKGTWPIEFWDLGKRVNMSFFEIENYYDIPKDCLRSSVIKNLFFAGRNISATEEAIASARVIGTCLQTGFSSGEMAVEILSSDF